MAKVLVSKVCGLCAGSRLAIDKTREAVKNQKNVVLFKEILHNKNVLKELENQGASTKNLLEEMTEKDYVIIRAHGEPKSTYDNLNSRNIKYLDCTCGNVKAINFLVNKKEAEGYKIILIGKYGFNGKEMHPEVKGTSGWCTNPIMIEDESEVDNIDMSYPKYFLVIQTTFSKTKAEKILEKIKNVMNENKKIFEYKNTICDAQKNINIASKQLAEKVDVMIVIGGKNSSNTKELYNAMKDIKPSYHIENQTDLLELINLGLISHNQTIGLTAGASTMLEDIENIKKFLETKV